MQNYKKFMAQIEERISKMGKKPQKTEGGIMSRKIKEESMTDADYINAIASYIATIRKTAQKVKAKNGA
jgi:hypothetical protein